MHKISADAAKTFATAFESEAMKALIEQTKAASDTGTFEVVITTENLDRYQEVIKLDGWQLEHYRNNPVVLWGHNHNNLIGMATSVEIIDGKMIAKGKFAPTEEGQEKRRLYDMGFLKATSVGFIEKEREGNLITKAELLEFSFVSVPANPYALKLSMEKGLNINELVTKGIMTVDEKQEEAPETEQIEPQTEETPQVDAKAIPGAIDALKSAIAALEALHTKEPEGNEDPEEGSENEEEVREFDRNRKLLQDASTVISDVLAEARRSIQTRKASA